ncbi:FAD/NAD-P-binding domain-containing protein [Schizopora paradoxa]|uniref:FAD/NAD-P-binding domain-containing protein n=1 Tax=Schizopora paradoxa TaxID=27342 RepID=A0A0H2RLC8_9AGAM|nr:FAD/NAD-P-binding domain-containing protein [Schizopora paradoxa]
MVHSSTGPNAIASKWLETFGKALQTKDVDKVVDHFMPHGWLRDALVFGWDFRALEGHKKIASYLSDGDALAQTATSDFTLDTREGLIPEEFPAGPNVNGIQFAFHFETPSTRCTGFTALLPEPSDKEGYEKWKALFVYVYVDEIKGHEEIDHESGLYEGHTRPWGEVKAERDLEIERNPNTVIIGGGQSGLMVAARFRAMGISTLVIEKTPRVGDHWRRRYPMLTLHTPRTHHQFLYAPFPKNWPTFTPRDRLASWMEQYVDTQDLVVWTSSYPLPDPVYDRQSGRWTLGVNKSGTSVVLHPANIIVATGALGDANIPTIPSASLFKGVTMHSSNYMGGTPFVGKKVLVVGSGNTSADVCQDLVTQGAASVTMIQRSSSYVISSKLFLRDFNPRFKEGVHPDINDLKTCAMPLGLLKHILGSEPLQQDRETFDKEMLDGLARNGFKWNPGIDGSGIVILVYSKLGGYFIDVGVTDMIIDGRVKVKSGIEISEFKETGVKFSDGSEQEADAVIFATGFKNTKPSMANIFGEEIISRTKKVWGMDEEGEISGSYRPTGHPGLWFATGDFFNARVMSKQLALQIKAQQLGLSSSVGLASSKLA